MLLTPAGCKLERMCLNDSACQITWYDHVIRSISLIWIQCLIFSRPKNLKSIVLKSFCGPRSVSHMSGCCFHWWKFSCIHLARVSLPSCLLATSILQVLLPSLFFVGNRIKHIICYISITRITALSLVSLILLTHVTLFWVAVLVKSKHFWSLKPFNSIVILQFK